MERSGSLISPWRKWNYAADPWIFTQSSHGFDRTLRLVSTRREDAELDEEEAGVSMLQ